MGASGDKGSKIDGVEIVNKILLKKKEETFSGVPSFF
jgi:hypothetical protein